MQPSLVFKTLLSFIVIAAAYPTPSVMELSSLASATKRGGLGSNLVDYLDARSPNDVNQPSIPGGPPNSHVDYLNNRALDDSRSSIPSNTPSTGPSTTSGDSNDPNHTSHSSNTAISDAEYLSVRAPDDNTSHSSNSPSSDADYLSVRAPDVSNTSNPSNTSNSNGDQSDGD